MQMKISFPGGSRVDATVGTFRIATDQPVDSGGDGTAPAPFDYFLASLGTCAGLYLLRFLERRHLPTEDLSLVMETTRDPQSGRIAEVHLSVGLPPEFPRKYERAIVNAVNLCSVKKHLENPPTFHTEVVIHDRPATVSPGREENATPPNVRDSACVSTE